MEAAKSTQGGVLGTLKDYIPEFDPITGPRPRPGESHTTTPNLEKAWADWKTNFETCPELENIPKTKWALILGTLAGRAFRDKQSTLECDPKDYTSVITAWDAYYKTQRSINATRHAFFNTRPQPEESTRRWMERCQDVGVDCEFDAFSLKDALLLNMVQYTPIQKLRNEILVKDMKFDEALKYAATLEMAETESKRITAGETVHQ